MTSAQRPKITRLRLGKITLNLEAFAAKPMSKIRTDSNSAECGCWAETPLTWAMTPKKRFCRQIPSVREVAFNLGLFDTLPPLLLTLACDEPPPKSEPHPRPLKTAPKPCGGNQHTHFCSFSPPSGWAKAQQARPNASLTAGLLFGALLRSSVGGVLVYTDN